MNKKDSTWLFDDLEPPTENNCPNQCGCGCGGCVHGKCIFDQEECENCKFVKRGCYLPVVVMVIVGVYLSILCLIAILN